MQEEAKQEVGEREEKEDAARGGRCKERDRG